MGILIILCIIIVFCKVYTKKSENIIQILVNEEVITFLGNDMELEKELKMLSIEKETKIKNLSSSKIYVNGEKINPGKELKIRIPKINEENKIEVKLNFKNKYAKTTYMINTLPGDFPEYEVEGNSKYEGDYYFTVDNYLLKLNEVGEIIFYKKTDNQALGFKKYTNNKKTRYTYLELSVIGQTEIYSLCDLVVLDEEYKEIDRVKYKIENKEELGIDAHDSVYLDDGHYILVTYKGKEVINMPKELGYESSVMVRACLIKEIKNGHKIWEFESTDYPQLYNFYSANGVYINEITAQNFSNYMHFNSFAIDPNDNNLICSFRNQDAIMKINRRTGKMMWILGGKGDEFRTE